jgi:hypothetical protein
MIRRGFIILHVTPLCVEKQNHCGGKKLTGYCQQDIAVRLSMKLLQKTVQRLFFWRLCYGMEISSSNPCRCRRFFCSPKHPEWLSGPFILLHNTYRSSFSGDNAAVKLTTHLHRVPRIRMSDATFHSPYTPSCNIQAKLHL